MDDDRTKNFQCYAITSTHVLYERNYFGVLHVALYRIRDSINPYIATGASSLYDTLEQNLPVRAREDY